MRPSLGIVALLPRMCPGMFSNMLHWLTVERNPQAPPCHLESPKEKTNGWSPWPPMKSIVWGAPLYPRHTENKKLPSKNALLTGTISLPIAMQLFCEHCTWDALLPSPPPLVGAAFWCGWQGKCFLKIRKSLTKSGRCPSGKTVQNQEAAGHKGRSTSPLVLEFWRCRSRRLNLVEVTCNS